MFRFLIIALLFLPIKGLSDAYPIRYANGLIVTEAIIEGHSVLVILDTGAPGLVLNQKYYSADDSPGLTAMGINGSFECKTRQVDEWQWLGTTTKKTKALVSDLAFLEQSLQLKIHALIGLSVLTDYFVSINLDQQDITLSKVLPLPPEQTFLRFQYANHLPVINCKINGERKVLGLDSGSGGNYLFGFDAAHDENLLAHASPILVTGTDNKADIKHQVTLNLEVFDGDLVLPSTFIVDLKDEGYFHPEGFDGILGQEFLRDYNLIIHPGKQKILFQPRMENHLVIE